MQGHRIPPSVIHVLKAREGADAAQAHRGPAFLVSLLEK